MKDLRVSQFIRCNSCSKLIGSSERPPKLGQGGLCDDCWQDFKDEVKKIANDIDKLKSSKK